MVQYVSGQLHRIIPAEVFEVDENERSVRKPQTIVKAEIGRNQGPFFLWQHGPEVKAGRGHFASGAVLEVSQQRIEGTGQERHEIFFGAALRTQGRQPVADLRLQAQPRQASLRRFSLEHAVSRRVEVWEKHEINRLTPTQLNGTLNVLLIKLAAAKDLTEAADKAVEAATR